MPLSLHFLDWDAPVVHKVRDFLRPEQFPGPADFSNLLIIVPTRQAGRRLREELVLSCDALDKAMLSPRIETPAFFSAAGQSPSRLPTPTAELALWVEVLLDTDMNELQNLFPVPPATRDFSWALSVAKMLLQLRNTLVENGYLIRDIPAAAGPAMQEPERWQDLASLETSYLERIQQRRLEDTCLFKLVRSRNPKLPAGIDRLVIASVPDPMLLMIHALENLPEKMQVDILVHAPERLRNHFDAWGCPLVEKWLAAEITVPEPHDNILLASSPAGQSREVSRLISSESTRFSASEIGLGVPDTSVVSFLSSDLEQLGLPAYDPAGIPVTRHPLSHLLQIFYELLNSGSYDSFAAFLRHPDILSYLEQKRSLPPSLLLTELDTFQNRFLPQDFEGLAARFSARAGKGFSSSFPLLSEAVNFVKELERSFAEKDLTALIRTMLQTIYSCREINPEEHHDRMFMQAAARLEAVFEEFSSGVASSLSRSDLFALFLHRLGELSLHPNRDGASVDLDGWLELPWNSAPFLIVTGMNEGKAPDSRPADPFLPDSLCRALKLKNDHVLLARDTFLMNTLIHSRQANGRVSFIAGKTSSQGDPLKPSRLLFACPDKDLPERAALLFGDPGESGPNLPATISFPLDPGPPADIDVGLTRLTVSSFKEYLTCPFRFYLKNILKMAHQDDLKEEMDAMDFGSLAHKALEAIGRDEAIRSSDNTKTIEDCLLAELDGTAAKRYGSRPSLQLVIQLDAIRQRLSAAARTQAELVRNGWEVLRSELTINTLFHGMEVSCRIDRIDRHEKTGCLRIIDYKTSDTPMTPESVHLVSSSGARPYAKVLLGKKEKSWADLQLPLYLLLLRDTLDVSGSCEVGYFNLPKAAGAVGIVPWDISPELLDAAEICARGIIEDIQAHRFWPPAKVKYDDFGDLFYGNIEGCIDGEKFLSRLSQN